MEVSLDVHDASRHGENGTGGDLGRARLDEYIIKCRDDGVVDGILHLVAQSASVSHFRSHASSPMSSMGSQSSCVGLTRWRGGAAKIPAPEPFNVTHFVGSDLSRIVA